MVDKSVIDTMIAEAGGHMGGLHAVASVINNRSSQWGMTPLAVVKQSGQFEGYSNPGSASKKAQNDPKVRAAAEKAWNDIVSGKVADPTNGGLSFRASYASKGLDAPYGTKNIGGNVFALGNAKPQTALAAINQVAPNPQSRPPALGYASTPSSVRAITVNPNGSPASLVDALTAKYGAATPTPRGATGASVSGISLPEAMPAPRVASLAPSVPQQLVSHPVQTLRIDPLTNKVIDPNAAPSLQAALEAKAGRIASGQEHFTPTVTAPSVSRAPNTAVTKTVAQAGNVALPAGVVPKSVQRDMAAINAMQANKSGSPDDRSSPMPVIPKGLSVAPPSSTQLAAINNVKGAYQQPITHTAIASQERLPPLPPMAYVPGAPKPPAIAAIDAATVPLPRARPVPTVPVRGVTGPQPLTKFLAPNQRQNDTLTTAGNVAGNLIAGTPVGHVYSLLTGGPNTGGGILNGLFGYGGLFGLGQPTVSGPPPIPTAPVGVPFLNASGVNTSGMSDGQVQNALMNAITGKQRGSFGAGNSI